MGTHKGLTIPDYTDPADVPKAFIELVDSGIIPRFKDEAEANGATPVLGMVAVIGTTLNVHDGTSWRAVYSEANQQPINLAGRFTTTSMNTVGTSRSVFVNSVSAHGTLGNSTIFTVIDSQQRASQIAVDKNGGAMWFRGMVGNGPNWGNWKRVATTDDIAASGPITKFGSVSVRFTNGVSDDKAVSFTPAFKNVPAVVITPSTMSSSPGPQHRHITYTVKDKATTGFHIVGDSRDPMATWSGTIIFDWIAVATS